MADGLEPAPMVSHRGAGTAALALAQAVCTRLCHDLGGPAGALSGALEMLDGGDDAVEVAQDAARSIDRRLRFWRAAVGGTGEAKCAGNYAASLVAQAEAAQHGCDQVVWLDSVERRWIEEMGGMNLFFVLGSGDSARLITPRLTGSLLPGITRESLLTVATDLGIRAEEGQISVDDWREGCASGEITETFACGTAAVITPVGAVKSRTSGSWEVSDGGIGEVTLRLRQALLDIQTGAVPDRHNWLHAIC